MENKSITIIKNIGKALEILSSFTIYEPELGISEIAAKLGMYKSTVYRTLKTLEQYGFVIQNIHNQKYRLGFKLFDLGTVVISKLEVRDVALPFMQSLCAKTRETIALNVMDNDERVCIEKVESTESIKNVIPIGYRNPIYLTAAGKLLLSHLPDHVY
ncbi:MAG: IclR family transcriptional regulator [Firmicutes bacterium]|nr:IclR family transcriptional regulator [Bacillota bacterium]